MLWVAAAALMQIPAAQHFVATPAPGAPTAIAKRVDAICMSAPTDTHSLLALASSQEGRAARRDARVTDWLDLACTRATLAVRQAVAHAGWLMPQGTSWSQGTIATALHILAIDSTNEDALQLLGLFAFDEQNPIPLDSIAHVMHRAVAAGVTLPIVLRACDEYAIRLNENAAARGCAERALDFGRDSTWHLLRLARLAFRDADTVQGAHDFYTALAAARDSLAFDEAAWHVQWFVSPDEMRTWDSLPMAAHAAWIHGRLLARDVRDGQPTNARIAEHFSRLEYVLANFQLALPVMIRRNGGLVGSTPYDPAIRYTPPWLCRCEGLSSPAQPFRFYRRWQTDIDDRGMIWMRFGKPDEVVSRSSTANAREFWIYNLDQGPLELDFEAEAFTGSSSATRLVAGVLGDYMCGYDTWRCMLSTLAAHSQLTPEAWQRLRTADDSAIAVASTTDDNAPRGLAPLATNGEFYRLLDPGGSAVQGLLVYRLRLHDLVTHAASGGLPEASFQVTVRQLNTATDAITDTSFRRHVFIDPVTPHDAWLNGLLILPSMAHATAWSVVADQDGRRGRVAQDGLSPLADGPLQLSDLILGSDASRFTATIGTSSVFLPPANGFGRHDNGHLYYQVRSATPHQHLQVTLAFLHTDRSAHDSVPALEIRSFTSVHAGFNVIDQGVSFAQLGAGPYRLRLTLSDEQGLRVEQETIFRLR